MAEIERATGPQLAQITTGIVQLHREYYGKGPTKARSYAIDDTVVCILNGGFTTVEQTLLETGQDGEVAALRHRFQGVMKERFTEVVEAVINRKVAGYMSQIHPEMQSPSRSSFSNRRGGSCLERTRRSSRPARRV